MFGFSLYCGFKPIQFYKGCSIQTGTGRVRWFDAIHFVHVDECCWICVSTTSFCDQWLEGEPASLVNRFLLDLFSSAFAPCLHSTPGIVAAYVLRSPDQVTNSGDNRELSPIALYVPILPCFVLAGLWNSYQKEKKMEASTAAEEEAMTSEATGLLRTKRRETRRSSVVTIQQAFSRESEVNKRISGQMMGMTAFETVEEKEYEKKLQHDLDEWESLAEVDYS